MLPEKIEFREGKNIPPSVLQQLFYQEEFNDFLDLDDVQLHLETALYLVSAWNGQELVGYARLGGDGRIAVEISDVLVKFQYQGMGIGTELVKRLVGQIEKLGPYFIEVEPISDREAHIYAKFGFIEIAHYRRMERINPKLIRKVNEIRSKKNRSDTESG